MKEPVSSIFKNGMRGLIFDCDGVMIDSANANRYLYNKILASLGLPVMTREQEIFAFQATFLNAIHTLVPKNLHEKLDSSIKNVIDYDRDILPKIELMPGYRHFLECAKHADLKMAIDTNRTDIGIDKVLNLFDISSFFNPVMNCSIAKPKPSSEGVNLILNYWNFPRETVLFIGDSEDDKKAAQGAGVTFASFKNPNLEGAFTIPSWEAFTDILFGD